MEETVSTHSTNYRRSVKILICIGIVTCSGGVLWLFGGAGIYGSPVAGSFHVDALTGYPNYWAFWMMWVVIAGPISLLPCAYLEWRFPRVGAVAMIISAIFVAESGIRASRMYWGFSDDDALIVIFCISTPLLLFAASLLTLESRKSVLKGSIACMLIVCLLVAAITLRYQDVKRFWNANCPQNVHSLIAPEQDAVPDHELPR
jgi:hypothetical protein